MILAATAAFAVTLGVIIGIVLGKQRKLAHRLFVVAEQLVPDAAPTSRGLSQATSAAERALGNVLLRHSDTSLLEARLASALAMIPQGIVLFDHDRAVVFRNTAGASYLGAHHEEALVEEVINDLADEVIQGRSTAPARKVDLFGPPKRSLELRAIGLEESRGASALVVIDDVTARRRLEAIRRDFVANISHELKTPIGALGLLAETLAGEADPATARRLGERLVAEAFRLARVIDDLLELSTIETNETAKRELLPVDTVMGEAVDRVRGAAEQQGITIQVENAPLSVTGDRRQLVSAVYNLLENAVKYSDRGSLVSVRARRLYQSVDLSVQDHGCGIPGRDLERVFERFYRVDRGRSRETGGTGLGLAIVRHVANNHQGEVWVESHEGEGSTFTLRLPLMTSGVDDDGKVG